ncbi:hypothetical protein NMY22_g19234 [Coprinellus aureogranulatus]|nr:hypothetical protein NMY22_g19234 [Coprinellus aureogranulatus]
MSAFKFSIPLPSVVSDARARATLQSFQVEQGTDARESQAQSISPGGWLYRLGGRTFYSPNCYRPSIVTSPTPVSPNGCVIGGRDYGTQYWTDPQWWTKRQGFLAFTALSPDFSEPPLHPLQTQPRIVYDPTVDKLIPEESQWNAWRGLQTKIVQSVHLLRGESGAPIISPAYPCARVDSSVYRRGEAARLQKDISNAQSWFRIWLGALSYAISVSKAMVEGVNNGTSQRFVPSWIEILFNHADRRRMDTSQSDSEFLSPEDQVDCAFISSVRSSCIARFDDSVSRVGVFVEIPDSPADMASIAWLVNSHVAVWYPWESREEEISTRYPSLKRYAPPANAEWVTSQVGFSSPAPSLPHHIQGGVQSMDEPSANGAGRKVIRNTWFDSVTKMASVLQEFESSAQRARRAKRELSPPSHLLETKFYIWDDDVEGAPMHRRATAEESEDIYEGRQRKDGRRQARYDSFFNEWDFYESSALLEDDLLADQTISQVPAEGANEEEQPQWASPLNDHTGKANRHREGARLATPLTRNGTLDDTTRGAGSTVQEESLDNLEEELSSLRATAYSRLGFTCHLTVSEDDADDADHLEKSDTMLQVALKILGVKKRNMALVNHIFWSSSEGISLLRFISRLGASGSARPSPGSWDISKSNIWHVLLLQRSRYLRVAEGSVVAPQEAHWNNVRGRRTLDNSALVLTNENHVAYWFDIEDDTWMYGHCVLGSRTATTALSICRLHQAMSPFAAAWELASKGMPFQTWYRRRPSDVLFSNIRARPELIPFRLKGHSFRQALDYEEYTAL